MKIQNPKSKAQNKSQLPKLKSKIFFWFGSWILILGFTALAVGCGQGVKSEISVVPGQPTGLSIRGTVLSTVNGTATGKVAGAQVSLSGVSNTTTITDTDGNYVFENVNTGSYTVVVTKEGFQMGRSSGSFVDSAPSNAVLTLDVSLDDNPVINSVTIEASSLPETIVVTFSEPMDKATVLANINYAGTKLFGAIETAASWSSDGRILYVRPTSSLLPSSKYSLYLAGQDSTYASMRDLDGNGFDRESNTVGTVAISYYYSYYGSGQPIDGPLVIELSNISVSETAPTVAPANLKVVTSSSTTEIDYQDIDYYGHTLSLGIFLAGAGDC